MPKGHPAHIAIWSEAMRQQLRELAAAGVTTVECARRLHVTKNAVCGMRRRMGLSTPGLHFVNPPRAWDTRERMDLAVKLRRAGATMAEIHKRMSELPGPPLPKRFTVSGRLNDLGEPSPVNAGRTIKRAPPGRKRALTPPPPPPGSVTPAPPKAAQRAPAAAQTGVRPCRFIYDMGPWLFREPHWCDQHARAGSVYCDWHHQICYNRGKRLGEPSQFLQRMA